MSNNINLKCKIIQSAKLSFNTINRPNPSLFFLPGLSSSPVWNEKDFNSCSTLKENYQIIKEEYLNAFKNSLLISDYSVKDNEHKLHKGQWNWYSYIQKGKINTSFESIFPQTTRILSSLDDLMINVPFSYTFFSELKSESHIEPHFGPCNIRLRIHFGIDIPNNISEDCYMNIQEVSFDWKNGECVVFDDSYLHSVVNRSNKNRVILLLDVWHPEISKNERKGIIEMFDKI